MFAMLPILAGVPNGYPNESTFKRVMQAVHSPEIAACLEVCTSETIKYRIAE